MRVEIAVSERPSESPIPTNHFSSILPPHAHPPLKMTTEKIRTKTSSKLLEDLAALAYETDHRKPEVVGAPTEKHSAISEAQGGLSLQTLGTGTGLIVLF